MGSEPGQHARVPSHPPNRHHPKRHPDTSTTEFAVQLQRHPAARTSPWLDFGLSVRSYSDDRQRITIVLLSREGDVQGGPIQWPGILVYDDPQQHSQSPIRLVDHPVVKGALRCRHKPKS